MLPLRAKVLAHPTYYLFVLFHYCLLIISLLIIDYLFVYVFILFIFLGSADIYLEDCVVPESARFPNADSFLKGTAGILSASRIFVGTLSFRSVPPPCRVWCAVCRVPD